MITVATDTLPQNGLTYLAFRISFKETLERITLAQQLESETEFFGYLTEVPFLRAVPPHVQLDLLAETWHRHAAKQYFAATVLDEAVIYAACETAARVAEHEPGVVSGYLRGGPVHLDLKPGRRVANELRSLHLSLSNDGDFLIVSQFEDIPPDDARRLKRDFGLDEARLECLFDALGRWSMSPGYLSNLMGLLSKEEIVRSALELGVM
jgi:hypothetical protein